MTEDVLGGTAARLPSPDEMAALLDRHADFRVLRRLTPIRRHVAPPADRGWVSGVALDVETTGLDHASDRIVELAMQRFWADRDGRITIADRSWTWFEDPGRPLAPEVAALTRLSDADLRGRRIVDAEAASILMDVDLIVAHNASFDRPFVERRLPDAAGNRWVCTVRDVDWRGRGFEGRTLSHLLTQMGWFHEAHRADADVYALMRLLDHVFPDGTSVLQEAMLTAGRPSWVLEAVAAPFESRAALRARGYRWNAGARTWSREVPHGAFDAEYEWLVVSAYGGRGRPRFRQVDWHERYAGTA